LGLRLGGNAAEPLGSALEAKSRTALALTLCLWQRGLRRPSIRGNKLAKALSHYDKAGRVRMVDVTEKPATSRTAIAHAFVRMKRATVQNLRRLKSPKGNPLEIARIAGITAAKRTSELIPLCHPLALTHVDVRAKLCQNGIEITSEATATGPTGVEMEALVGASVAALTIYDMCKALERSMEITDLYLLKKSGGRSGTYVRGASSNERAGKNGK
jgi:cyclic pyranopterin monophosphate synthase